MLLEEARAALAEPPARSPPTVSGAAASTRRAASALELERRIDAAYRALDGVDAADGRAPRRATATCAGPDWACARTCSSATPRSGRNDPTRSRRCSRRSTLRLDAARRLRLAQDRWKVREPRSARTAMPSSRGSSGSARAQSHPDGHPHPGRTVARASVRVPRVSSTALAPFMRAAQRPRRSA